MKYSLQCRYSMVEQAFMFIIRSTQQNNYEFTWLISNVDKPLYVLTNNNIVFKSHLQDNFVIFDVIQSPTPIQSQTVMTKTVPMLVFETDIDNLQIIYDYDHLPNKMDKIVGMIIHEFLEVAGGGFLNSQEQYTKLQNNISSIVQQVIEEKKLSSLKNNSENVKQIVGKAIVKQAEQVTAKTQKTAENINKTTNKKTANKKTENKQNKKNTNRKTTKSKSKK